MTEPQQNLQYDWHTIAHPFDLVTEVSGIVPIIVWLISYDHYWHSRLIHATLSSPEIAVSLSPEHIHTAFLHLDDYTDVNSACNEWFQWLLSNHRESLKTEENEKIAYCETYAKIIGQNSDSIEGRTAVANLRELERRMSGYEIISLRCIAMGNKWKIPSGSNGLEDELATFLNTSCSSIVKNNDIGLVPFDEPCQPFKELTTVN
jgi:hypothetical protein